VLAQKQGREGDMDMADGLTPKRFMAYLALVILMSGLAAFFLTGGTP
jgi:hypothetical protein